MLKGMLKRFVALFLAFVIVFGVMPETGLVAKAAVENNLSNTSIGLSSDANGEWTASGTRITGKVEVKTGSCNSYEAQSTTLTITNKNTVDATLRFKFRSTNNTGTIVINGTTYSGAIAETSSGDISLAASTGSIQIVLTSGASENDSTSIEITEIELLVDSEPTVTFLKPEGGSYTVTTADSTDTNNPYNITENTTFKQASTDVYTVSATANEGYKFAGWVVGNELVKTAASTTLSFEKDTSVRAMFISDSLPVFWVQKANTLRTNLADAITDANGNDTIILLQSGSLSPGTYTIPSGVTLLLPYDEGKLEISGSDSKHPYANSSMAMTSTSMVGVNSSLYRVLTIPVNTEVIVETGGQMIIGGVLGSTGQGTAGHTSGMHSNIQLEGKISVNGGLLSTCGYIYGSGSIHAVGGKIYQPFVIGDYCGGSYTTVSYKTTKISPFNYYGMENIQTKMFFSNGTEMYGYCDLWTSNPAQHNMTTALVVSASGNGLLNYGTSIEFSYDETKKIDVFGKTTINIQGGGSVGSLTLVVEVPVLGEQAVDTGSILFPVPYNYDINIESGTFQIPGEISLKLLPGAQVTIAEEASMEIAGKVAIYDGGGFKLYTTKNYPSDATLYAKGLSERGRLIVEGELIVNGTLGGWVETTGDTGSITLGESAVTSIQSVDGVSTDDKYLGMVDVSKETKISRTLTAQVMAKGEDGSITRIELLQGETYYGTAASTPISGYTYTVVSTNSVTSISYNHQSEQVSGVWSTGFTVTLNANGAPVEDVATTYEPATFVTVNTVSWAGHNFLGWNTKADGTGTTYTVSDNYLVDENGSKLQMGRTDFTLYAQWDTVPFTITLYESDGVTVWYTITADCDTAITFPASPTKTGMKFLGWADAQGNIVELPSTMPDGGLTLTASWERLEYTLTLLDGLGSTINEYKYYYNDVVEEVQNPTKDGYTFSGWDKTIPATMPAENVTITAQWTANNYTVSLAPNGEDVTLGTSSKNVTFGQTYGELPTPTRPGYEFVGWATTVEGGTTVSESTVLSTASNHTLYAQWDAIDYTITYELDGGTNSSENPGSYNVETGVIALKDPSKPGYTFDKWVDKDGVQVTQIVDTTAGNITLTAIWTANTYTIIFDVNGGTAFNDVVLTQTMTYDQAQVLPTPEQYSMTGHTFAGWNTMADGSGTSYGTTEAVKNLATGGTITLYAQWEANSYTITFDSDGGSAVGSITADYGTAISWPANPVKEGYSFSHWEDGSGNKVDSSTTITMPVGGLALKAKWTINSYTISFVDGSGSTLSTITENYGTAITKPADPTRTGYTFAGWDKEIPSTMPAENMTITAQWTVNQYTITFNTDGGSTIGAITRDYGTAIEKPADPTKTGYTFAGWDKNIPDTMPAENMTITAQWTINSYTIKFTDTGDTEIQDITLEYGATIPVVSDPTMTGYEFKGWSPEIPEKMPADNMTIQATWSPIRYTITFDEQGGSEVADITADYESAITAPADPTKTGYTFAGWEDASGNKVAIPATMPLGGLTLKAIWDANEYMITFDEQGGTEVADITQDYDTAVMKPADPTKTGYTFKGWMNAEGILVEFPEKMPVDGLALTAKWEINKYTITFANTGDTVIAPITQEYNSAVTAPEDPTKTGYTFDGWDVEVPDTMPAGDMTITARWTINQYTITFDTDGGTVIDAITQDYNTSVTAPADPTKKGYTFIGWLDAEGKSVDFPETIPAENVTLNAEWKINQYTITFDTDGGSAVDPITQDYNTSVTAPAAPTKEGYTFKGWDKEIPATMPAGDMTITAVWEANTYTVRLDTAGGELTGENTITVTYDQYYNLPMPTRDGYTFEGWYMGETKITTTTQVKITEDATVTAKWEVGQSYGIDYNLNGGAWETDADPKNQYNVETETFSLPQPVREGYTFAGWTGSNGTTPQKEVTVVKGTTGELSYIANWTINQYTITFDTDGGSAVAPITGDYNSTVTAPADPTKTGYTFAGWDVEIPTTMPAENITIKATWTINQYTITFDTDGGSAVAPITQDYNSAVTAPADPTKTGYTFAGWDKEIPTTMPAENITIKATWTINQYTITFDTDGGSAVAPITQDYNSPVTAPADPTKAGYTFAGWSAEIPVNMPAENITIKATWTINQYTITFDTDGGTEVAPITQDYDSAVTAPADPTKEGYAFAGWDKEIPATMPAESITITAQWTINQYTITFDTDGGTAVAPITQDYDTAVAAPADPTKTGYTFAGWMNEKDEIVLVPSTMPAGNLTLKAKWTINQYTITFDTDGGNAIDAITQDYNTSVTAPADPTKTGYTFAGWDVKIPSKMPAENITITATWTINQYTITFDTDGGTAVAPITQDYNTAVTAPANPAKKGYTFAGWDAEIPAKMPAGDMTIKAQWTIIEYTISFDEAGGDALTDITYTVETEEFALPTPTRTGYTFLNWTDGEGNVVSTVSKGSIGNLELTANWMANEDTVYRVEHYLQVLYRNDEYVKDLTENLTGTTNAQVTPEVKDYEGFTAPVAQEVTIKADGTLVVKYYYTRNSYKLSWVWGTEESERAEITYPYGASIAAGPTPTRTGYTFGGWSEEIPSTMPANDVTINAVWNIVTYNININLNSGTAENLATYTVESGAITLNNPIREGYTFTGWSGTELTGSENMTVTIPAGSTGNRAYTANWRQNKYTIRFDGNGSTDGEMADQSFTYDVQSTLNGNVFERIGYTFNGWKDVDGNSYTNGQSINNLTAVDGRVITLYAQWTADTYKVYFLPNSGTGTAYSLDVIYDGEAVTIPDCIFSRVGYTFCGWNTQADGSGTDYAVGSTVANLTADLRLYAQWTANTYKVVFDANGGTGTMADQLIVFDTGVNLNPNLTITKEGYSFTGWNTKADGTGIAYADGAAVRNLVASGEFRLYAQWKINQYTITFDTVGGTLIAPITQDYNTTVKAPADPTRPGYRFDGWDVTIPSSMPAENVTITAKWTSYLDLLMAIDPDSFANAESDAVHKDMLELAREYYNLMKLDADLLAQYQSGTEVYPEKEYTYVEHYERLFAEIKEVSLIELEASVENDTTIGNINDMLHDKDTGNEIAKMEADASTNKVEVSLADEEYLALNMLGIPFLTELFKNNEIWSVDFPILKNETDGNGNPLTPYGSGVASLEQMELMLRIAFATINEPEITGEDHKLTYQEFFDWLYAQKETLQIGVLDGTAIEVVVNAVTVEGAEYSTTYYISFYNRDHQITWDPANGENATEETYSYGDAITVPTPVRGGYTFLGWEDAEGNAPSETMGKTDLIYTAKWKINQYTITFANTGDTVIDPITKDFGAAVTAPADPTREGYTFDGWDVEVPATMPAGDMTITAKWKANTYTITFENTGDSAIAPITGDFGTAITAPADPVKEGYTFDGWDVEIPATMPAKDLTITAKWKINSYTITFDTDGGSAIAPITQEYNTAVTMPKNPTKEGYTFAGWSVEIPATMPAENMIITAQWKINQYTITFDTVGGTTIDPITGDFGTAIGKITEPEKVGHSFKGWDVEIPATMPAKNLTITAVWEANKYTVTLNPGEGTLPGGSSTITVTYGEYYVLPTPEREGYTFDGWYLGSEKITDTTLVEITADAELTARWKVGNPYDVDYVLGDNAKWPTGANVVYQFTVEDSFTLPTPVREGYTFIGWTGSNGTTPQMSVTVAAGTTEDLQFTANWKVNSYTITFDTDGGSTVVPIEGDFGTAVTKPADPTKEGYTFAGWDVTIPTTMPAGDLTITATWTVNEYTITFDSDGGTAVAPITKDFGEAVTAPAAPTREGYTFAGWSVEIPSTMPAKNLTIKALWTVNQYTITFDTDGGTAVESITLDFGAAVTKPENPMKPGYTFAGWSAEIPATMPAKDMTIKAIWTINQYTITFDTNGGSAIDPIIRNYGAAVTAPVDPTREGYTFAGWDVEIPATMPAENITITAQWDINEYTITFVTSGGTEIRPMTQFFGSKVTAPEDPTREGYTFDGWDVEIPDMMPAKNLTITARWTINSYNLIYKVDGEIIETISLNYGSAISVKIEPVKEGYTFSGWSTAPDTMPAQDVEISGTFTANRYTVHFDPNYPAAGQITDVTVTFDGKYGTLPVVTRTGYTFAGWMLDGVEITADSVVKMAGEQTLTAKWKANTYQVTLNPNQGTLAGSNTITVTYDGTYADLPVPTRTGYDFIGWFDGETQISTDTVVSITAAQTLTAKWNASGDTPYHVYHYQANLNGGYDLVLKEPFKGAADTTAQATQKNYTGFTYNSGKSTASGTILADGSLVLSLYYDRASYDIVWQVGAQEIRETYKYGQILNAPNTDRADDDRASYTFTGWNVTLPTTVAASATYVAQYALDYEATIGATTYRTLKLALANAKSGDLVVIARNVTVTEDLVVPAGVTLLIPCMDNDPGYVSRYNGNLMFNPDGTAVNGNVGVAANAELYRKLVIPEGVTLTIDGTVMVNAITGRPAAGHYDQDVSDDYGQIDLDGDIVVRDGGQLDSFGFIKGSGTVTAKDGGTVGDLYVVRHWRGGSQAYQMYVENIYPMNEYDCHNIEADIRVEYGGSYEGLVKMYAGGEYNYTRFPQVDVDNGLIRLEEGGYVLRSYANGRETYDIYGGAELASSALTILGVDLTSADFMYPYDGDISLNLNDGKYYIVNNYKFLPGCVVTVGKDASLTVEKGVTVVFYQEFNDVGNRGTEYPDRDPAKVVVKAGGSFTNAGTFAGHINTESPNIWIGEGPVWETVTKEANGYFTDAQNKGEPTYVELTHTLSIERPGHTWSFGTDQSIVWDGKADYSKVQQAIASIPKDLDYYTADSIAAIQPALDQVVYDLDVSEQARVDAMAEPILAAVAGLIPRTITVTFDPNGGTVDTTTMDVTCTMEFGTLPTPTREYYRFIGWYDADGNKITKTSIVTAKENLTLTAQWQIEDADYGVVRKAIRKIPKDLTIYTDESVAALEAAQNAIEYNLTADRQGEVDAMAQAILDAIDGLKLWPITITFNANGGTVDPISVEATYGETFGALPDPIRTGYRFDGWYTADGTLVTADTAVPANEDMTLTAKWTLLPAEYSAVENAMNKIPVDLSIYTDASVNALEAAVNAVDYDLMADQQAKVDAMAKDILDAIDGLKLKTVTITFVPNGGTVDPTSKVVTVTGTYGTLPTPVRAGYRFDGWYTADGKQATEQTVVSSDAAMTLTAKWTIIPADYSAVEEALAKIPADLSIYSAETVASLQAAKDAVEYGLSTADQAKVDAMAKKILDAIDGLTLRKFVITFDAVYGTVTPSSKEVDYNTAYGELPVPTRTNYRFLGWVNEAGQTVTAQTVLDVTKDITLTAKWEALGADYSAVEEAIQEIPADLSIYTAETVAALRAAETAVVNGLPKEKQAEVDAMAKAIVDAINGLRLKTVKVTLAPNGGTVEPTNKVVTLTETFGTLPTPERAGYRFDGWYTADGKQVTAETVVSSDADVTLTAKWTMIPADYSAVEDALAKIPADLSIYTQDTAEAVKAAKEAVEYGLSTADQAKVDAMAKAILDAIEELEAVLESIEITKMPEKLLYIQGESLRLEDMVVTARYRDGSSEVVTDYRVSGYNAAVLGLQKLTITYDGKTTTLTVNVRSLVPTRITSDVYLVKDEVIRKIPAETTAEKLTAGINEREYITIFNGSAVVSGKTLAGTGMVVELLDGDKVNDQVTVVVTGDVNGDGKITITDMIMVKSHLLKKSTLTGAAAYAADTNGDGKISITDFVQMKSHLLNKSTIQAN